jgi:rhodanese-related sulfurtransferase
MPITEIDAKTLKSWIDSGDAMVVDVREPAEFASQKIEGATLLPLGKCCKATLPDTHGKKLVIHCRSGGRGASACQKLLQEDPSLEIYHLKGGISAWESSGETVACSGKNTLPLDRQVQLVVGLSVLTGSVLGYYVNPAFFMLSGFFGAGLTFAGATGFCGLALVLAKMPWNQCEKDSASAKTICMTRP